MYKHLKDHRYYKELYDRLTVESARRGMSHYDTFYSEFESKLPVSEKVDKPGSAFLLNVFYMETVGSELLDRYENRDSKIQEWINRDRAKDEQISSARLAEEPSCQHCDKQGLRIIDKSLMHRGDAYEIDDPEEVLFMLRCPHCDKNSAFWEDGKERVDFSYRPAGTTVFYGTKVREQPDVDLNALCAHTPANSTFRADCIERYRRQYYGN
ncbi:hypothetical protein FJZ39_03895 [Candidatus Saccharibacteria bacterium]|nr:hypothetical protein [Candidatus Saccharibacteria bacterium]